MPGETVAIMLSTWNGERFLTEQLGSLLAQEGDFTLKLEIRDDGSTDGTVPLLKGFCDRLSERTRANGLCASLGGPSRLVDASFAQGGNLGFVGSYFELLRQSAENADWYAFCDQDDVWQPDKLQRAIHLLKQAEHGSTDSNAEHDGTGIPLLYASRLQMTDAVLRPIGYTARVQLTPSFQNALVENIVTGATIVMNRVARNLLLAGIAQMAVPGEENLVPVNKDTFTQDSMPEKDPLSQKGFLSVKGCPSIQDVLLHDWWCYLVISAFGRVLHDPESRILYRQHGGNTIGQQRGFLARQKVRIKRIVHQGNVRGVTRQVQLFSNLYAERLPQRPRHVLTRFLARDESLWKRIAYVIRPDVQRQTWYDNVILRVLMLFGNI